jgi:phospholipid/cholesterol/gamma-HCH transport system substrate-binding protein
MRREIKIGIFLAGAFLIMAVFIFVAGDLSTWFQKPGYDLSVLFPSATGLEKHAAVRLAGVKIGYVKDIRLDERKARVILAIWPKYQVPKGSRATLASLGLVGERYIEISPSEQADFLKPGETLEAGATVGFDQIGGLAASIGDDLKAVSVSIRELTSEETKQNLSGILKNLNSFTQELSDFMAANKGELETGIQSASQAARGFDQKLGEISRNLNETISAVKSVASENEESIKLNLQKLEAVLTELQESIRLLRRSLEKIDRGEGTVGKLVQDPALYDEARETLGQVKGTVEPFRQMRVTGNFRADYLNETEKFRGAISAGFYLTPGSFLLGQIVDDPRQDGFVYSAQAGMRFGAVAPRAGVIESELGAGVDLLALSDRLMFSLEGFDFQRDGGPRLRLSGQFALLRYLHLVLGVDDFGSDSRREVFFGLGLGTR